MKKLLYVFASLAFLLTVSIDSEAMRLKVKPFQYNILSGGGSSYSLGIGFEKADGGMLGVQHNIDLDFSALNPRIRYMPQFRFYFLDEAPKGLYAGPYANVGFTTAGGGARIFQIFTGAGVTVGYQMFFADDKFSADINFNAGFAGTLTTGGGFSNYNAGFNGLPSIAMGFHF